MQGWHDEFEGGWVIALEGGGQYSKNTKIKKSWGVYDPPAPIAAPPLGIMPLNTTYIYSVG